MCLRARPKAANSSAFHPAPTPKIMPPIACERRATRGRGSLAAPGSCRVPPRRRPCGGRRERAPQARGPPGLLPAGPSAAGGPWRDLGGVVAEHGAAGTAEVADVHDAHGDDERQHDGVFDRGGAPPASGVSTTVCVPEGTLTFAPQFGHVSVYTLLTVPISNRCAGADRRIANLEHNRRSALRS